MLNVEEKLREIVHSLEQERKAKSKSKPSGELSDKAKKAMRQITERFKVYDGGEQLHVGDIVKWKSGMRNRRFPTMESVAIVTKVYDEPIFDPKGTESGSPSFREPLSVVLGIIDEDDDFVEFHYDANRFELAAMMDTPPRQVEVLRERLALMQAEEPMAVGDIVTWKVGMRNKRHPENGTAALVVKVLPETIYDIAAGAGSPYFNEPLNFVIGVVDDDNDFICFHSDPRRFTHVPEL
jgi:hypothetical protein